MSPTADFLFRLLGAVLFLALVASVLLGRRRSDRAAVAHDPHRCRECVQLRHPCNRVARAALAAIPHQTRGGDQ